MYARDTIDDGDWLSAKEILIGLNLPPSAIILR